MKRKLGRDYRSVRILFTQGTKEQVMILNRCRMCKCPLDPGERYCEECQKIIDGQEEEGKDANENNVQGKSRSADEVLEWSS